MLAAFILSMPERPDVQRLTDYYARAMMTGLVRRVFRASGKSQFTEKDIEGMRRTAALRAGDRNPYSWNMDFYEYPDGTGYEARFSRCGICTLMQELGLQDLTPALCHLDYTMAECAAPAILCANSLLRRPVLRTAGKKRRQVKECPPAGSREGACFLLSGGQMCSIWPDKTKTPASVGTQGLHRMVRGTGLEPVTPCTSSMCSSQLS